jgi:membrane-associated phospholipid phosphatase
VLRQWIWLLSPAMVFAIAFFGLSRVVRRTPVIPRELSLDRSLTARAPAELSALSTAIDVQHWVFVVLAVVIALLLAKRFRQALLVLLAEPLAEALSLGLKVLINRQLPDAAPHVGLAELDALLFPSGHVVRVTVTVGLLVAFVAWPYARIRWPATLVAVAFIGLVGVTQTTVGGHLPLDVVGGALLGGAIVNVVYVLERAWTGRLSPNLALPDVRVSRSLALVRATPRYSRTWVAFGLTLVLLVAALGTMRAPAHVAHLAGETFARTHSWASRLHEWVTSV